MCQTHTFTAFQATWSIDLMFPGILITEIFNFDIDHCLKIVPFGLPMW